MDYLRDTRNPETEWLEIEADRKRLGLTDLILCEVLQGVRGEQEFALVQSELQRFELLRLAERNWQLRQRETAGESAKKASPFLRR